MSACLPISMEPITLDRRMACAELIVAAVIACAGVNPMYRQDNAIAICIDSFHEVPGLQSVAKARIAFAFSNLCAGVYSFSASPKGVHGKATATVSDFPRAAISASEVLTR